MRKEEKERYFSIKIKEIKKKFDQLEFSEGKK